jgi:hypothetical protein
MPCPAFMPAAGRRVSLASVSSHRLLCPRQSRHPAVGRSRVVVACAPAPGPGPQNATSQAVPASDTEIDTRQDDVGDKESPELSSDGGSTEGGSYGGDGGGGGGEGGSGSGDDGDEHHRYRQGKSASIATSVAERSRHATSTFLNNAVKLTVALFKIVPAPVLTTLIGISSGVIGQRKREAANQAKAMQNAQARAQAARAEADRKLREKYDSIHGPLLKAASKLSERLYTLVYGSGAPAWRDDGEPYTGSLYTAYLLGRYFAMVEVVKRQSEVLDLGFPAADRVFTGLLGRVQGVMAADDGALSHLQTTEAYFQPAHGEKTVSGGLVETASPNSTLLSRANTYFVVLSFLWCMSVVHFA